MSGGKTSPIIHEKPKKKPKKPRKRVRPISPSRRIKMAMPDRISQTRAGGILLEWTEITANKTINTELELRTFYDVDAIQVEIANGERQKMIAWKLRPVE